MVNFFSMNQWRHLKATTGGGGESVKLISSKLANLLSSEVKHIVGKMACIKI